MNRREHVSARLEANHLVGLRLRWLREAWEAREPGHHSQKQWACALGISPAMLNRIELGRYQAPLHILQRIIYFREASANYALFGVVRDGLMSPWLDEALLAAHPGDLLTLARFLEMRAMAILPPPWRGSHTRDNPHYRASCN